MNVQITLWRQLRSWKHVKEQLNFIAEWTVRLPEWAGCCVKMSHSLFVFKVRPYSSLAQSASPPNFPTLYQLLKPSFSIPQYKSVVIWTSLTGHSWERPVELWRHTRRNQISSFVRNGRGHLNRAVGAGRQFSWLLAAEVCGISGSNAGYTIIGLMNCRIQLSGG